MPKLAISSKLLSKNVPTVSKIAVKTTIEISEKLFAQLLSKEMLLHVLKSHGIGFVSNPKTSCAVVSLICALKWAKGVPKTLINWPDRLSQATGFDKMGKGADISAKLEAGKQGCVDELALKVFTIEFVVVLCAKG